MVRVFPFLPLFILLSAAIAAAGANAAGRWDGEYRGEGKFDIDRNCIPRKFEAIGTVRDNVLYISVKRREK
ncbi:MAG: hypothetical protein ACE5JZ_06205, partial [Kiloniellales bacterium]